MKLGKVWAACATISETPLLSLKQGDLLPTGHFPMLWSAPSRNVFWHLFVFLEVISNLSEAATSVPFDIERHFLCRRESSSMFTNLKCTLLPLWSFGKWLYCQVGDFCVWGLSRPLSPRSMTHTVQTGKYTEWPWEIILHHRMLFQISFAHCLLFSLFCCCWYSRSHSHQRGAWLADLHSKFTFASCRNLICLLEHVHRTERGEKTKPDETALRGNPPLWFFSAGFRSEIIGPSKPVKAATFLP